MTSLVKQRPYLCKAYLLFEVLWVYQIYYELRVNIQVPQAPLVGVNGVHEVKGVQDEIVLNALVSDKCYSLVLLKLTLGE